MSEAMKLALQAYSDGREVAAVWVASSYPVESLFELVDVLFSQGHEVILTLPYGLVLKRSQHKGE
jgi:hypothetical protein